MRTIIRPRTANYQTRDALVANTYFPDATNTGHLGLSTLTTTITTNQTYSTSQTIQNTKFDGARVSVTGPNVTFRNCLFTGDNSASALVTCTNVNVSNAQFIDCTWLPKFPRYETNGISGHDFTLLRCDLSHCTDQVSPSLPTGWAVGDPIGVKIRQSYLHDAAWWTAATGGIVHPSDTETHNDLLQIQGGSGLEITGSTLDARFAKQYGHWRVTNPNVEPYVTDLGSQPDGGPFQHIPDRIITTGTGGTTYASGRYNYDDQSGVLTNNSQGAVTDVIFKFNLCIGGNYFWNGGGNPYPGNGEFLGTFENNAFTDDQGTGGGTGSGYTLAFLGSWAGHVTAPTTGPTKNYYLVGGAGITVRT